MGQLLQFSTTMELLRVPADSVVCITADGNYSTIMMADSGTYVLTMQLGHIERRIAEILSEDQNPFIRIGKSLIINHDFITSINPQRQKLILSDGRTFRKEVTASKEALRMLKEILEKEVEI